MRPSVTFIIWAALILFATVAISILLEFFTTNKPINRCPPRLLPFMRSLFSMENFEIFVAGSSNSSVRASPSLDITPPGPAVASLDKPRQSYDLLSGGLSEPRVASGPTSAECYGIDYTRSLEKTRTFSQLTNNYKRKTSESCSAPNHDLILDFYEGQPTAVSY